MINFYHTETGIFNTSKFIKDILKKQQKTRFRGSGISHQNREAERTINMFVTIISTLLMQHALICHKDMFPTDFSNENILYCMDQHLDHDIQYGL